MKTTTLIGALLCSLLSNAQEWSSYFSNESLLVEFATLTYSQPKDGIQHERIVFRFKNLTSEGHELSYNRNVSYDPSGSFLNTNEKVFTLKLIPNEWISYDDSHQSDKTFYIYVKDIDGTIKNSLTNFELSNFQLH